VWWWRLKLVVVTLPTVQSMTSKSIGVFAFFHAVFSVKSFFHNVCSSILLVSVIVPFTLWITFSYHMFLLWLIWSGQKLLLRFTSRMKKRSETQTLCTGCKVEPNMFAPPQTHFPGAQDRQNLISWRRSLPSPTTPV